MTERGLAVVSRTSEIIRAHWFIRFIPWMVGALAVTLAINITILGVDTALNSGAWLGIVLVVVLFYFGTFLNFVRVVEISDACIRFTVGFSTTRVEWNELIPPQTKSIVGYIYKSVTKDPNGDNLRFLVATPQANAIARRMGAGLPRKYTVGP